METKHNRDTALSLSETRYRTLVKIMGDGLSEIDENQVANLVKHGKIIKEIAQSLNLSGKTIEFYCKGICQKVGLTNKQINLGTFLNTPH